MQRMYLICGGVILACFVLYLPAIGFSFVDFDDPAYVTENRAVLRGLSSDGISYAFSNTEGFWHPLTWLSLMLDSTISKSPRTFHLTNIWLHSFNAVLVFLISQRLSGRLWPSVLLALLFAWHPLNVESVAWVSERKGLLAAVFGLVSFWFYTKYTATYERPAYVLVCVFFAFSLMSKPVILAYPLILLLTDWWPLQRLRSASGALRVASPGECTSTRARHFVLIEKIPLFLMAVLHGS